MTEIEMFAAIGRKQTELDNLHVEYNRLLSVLGSIAAGDVSADRVRVDLVARTWAVEMTLKEAEPSLQ